MSHASFHVHMQHKKTKKKQQKKKNMQHKRAVSPETRAKSSKCHICFQHTQLNTTRVG